MKNLLIPISILFLSLSVACSNDEPTLPPESQQPSDEPEQEPSDEPELEPLPPYEVPADTIDHMRILNFNGNYFKGIKNNFNVSYNDPLKFINGEKFDIIFSTLTGYPLKYVLDKKKNLFFIDTDSFKGGSVFFNPIGCVSNLRYSESDEFDGNTFYTSSDSDINYDFFYDISGHITEMKTERHSETFNTSEYHGSSSTYTGNRLTSSEIKFEWEKGNLVKISINTHRLYIYEGGPYTPKNVDTHNLTEYVISYDPLTENSSEQFFYTFGSLLASDKIIHMMAPTGVMGRGPVNIPNHIKVVKDGELEEEYDFSILIDTLEGIECIASENYKGNDFIYQYGKSMHSWHGLSPKRVSFPFRR